MAAEEAEAVAVVARVAAEEAAAATVDAGDHSEAGAVVQVRVMCSPGQCSVVHTTLNVLFSINAFCVAPVNENIERWILFRP